MAHVKLYYIYIMANPSRMLYTGMTNDLFRRVSEHKAGCTPGFTRAYRLHRLVYFEYFRSVHSAIAREKQIKGWLRKKKIALIEKDNATWADLAGGWYGGAHDHPKGKAYPSLRSG